MTKTADDKPRMNKLLSKKVLLLIFVFAGLIFLSIPLVNHYFLRTSALDYGVFNHAIYNYAHVRISNFTLGLIPQESGIIEGSGNHFSPILLLFSPFYWILGTYTLLVFQVAFILFGGAGIWKYSCSRLPEEKLSLLSLIQFFSIWGIYSALAFDFHLNVLAAMLLPWLFYFNLKGNRTGFLLVLLAIILCRENMSLWMCFVLPALWFDKSLRQEHWSRWFYFGLATASAIYFILCISNFMPYFVPFQSNGQLTRYSHLGSNLTDILFRIIKHPGQILELLLYSQFDDPVYQSIKFELHLMVLLAGGLLFVKKPWFLLMLIPVYFQKLLSNDTAMWGINYHYSIEFAPVLSLLLIETIRLVHRSKVQWLIAGFLLFTTLGSTIYTFFHRESVWYDKAKTCFFCPEHYRSELNASSVHAILAEIPEDAPVSAYFGLAPQLAYREKIYHFPVIQDAYYIVIQKNTNNFYPINEAEYFAKIDELRVSPDFSVWKETDDIVVFKQIIKSTLNQELRTKSVDNPDN